MTEQALKFTPLKSFVDSSFFQRVSNLKLDEFKLDTSAKSIYASIPIKSLPSNEPVAINLSSASFIEPDPTLYPPSSTLFLSGTITILNTIEEFKGLNKHDFLKEKAQLILSGISNGEWLESPSLLNSLDMICFADLKKFKFYYWCCTPFLSTKWDVVNQTNVEFMPDGWEDFVDKTQGGFFLLNRNKAVSINGLRDCEPEEEIEVGFVDATHNSTSAPSKLLNNFLAALSISGFHLIKLTIIRYNSQSLQIRLRHIETDPTKVTGWERALSNKLAPKLTDLSSLIDPKKLSEQSVDLNLKLMKWRIAPELNLDIIKETKFLLLGSGTLGSYVARALLGWGARNISMLDNGSVSHSNPVRQPLFNFEDVGKSKAHTAASALKKIFPLVNAKGIEISIPMIGHPVISEQKQHDEFDELEMLIKTHDVLFLLTDSREARWLPTVLGNVHGKCVINAALGFDSFLVMRHGNFTRNGTDEQRDSDKRLGCYFCNDILAPSDSLSDRTLDQMCTVTRPGVALLASALAVELVVSLLQHPEKQLASTTETTVLGELSHQLRGFLGSHQTLKLETPAYEFCAACSPRIIEEFKLNGWEFVKRVMADSKAAEVVSGLDDVHKRTEEAMADIEDWEEDDEW